MHYQLELPSGLQQAVDLVAHHGAVAIVARDAAGQVLVVSQYRAAASDWLLEIPAGRLEAGEEPLAAARRELEEETGYCAAHWRALTSFLPAPGFASERMHLFLAEGLEPAVDRLACDDDEEIEVRWCSPEQLIDGGTQDAKTLIAALLVAHGRV